MDFESRLFLIKSRHGLLKMQNYRGWPQTPDKWLEWKGCGKIDEVYDKAEALMQPDGKKQYHIIRNKLLDRIRRVHIQLCDAMGLFEIRRGNSRYGK